VASQHGNTVHFSNHTGYGHWRGQVLPAEDVAGIIRGIEDRGVLGDCDAVLSGYLGDASLGEVVVGAAGRVKGLNGEAVYCCDPVMGDKRTARDPRTYCNRTATGSVRAGTQ